MFILQFIYICITVPLLYIFYLQIYLDHYLYQNVLCAWSRRSRRGLACFLSAKEKKEKNTKNKKSRYCVLYQTTTQQQIRRQLYNQSKHIDTWIISTNRFFPKQQLNNLHRRLNCLSLPFSNLQR